MADSLLGRVVKAGKVLLGNSLLSSLSESDLASGTDRNEDQHAAKVGLDDYWDLALSDEQASACLSSILTISLPGIGWTPGEESEQGAKMARFVEAVNDKAEGSTLEMYQAILLNTIITGFSVVEYVWEPVVLPEFGRAIGLKGLYVRPSVSFTENRPSGIVVNANGDIVEFRQSPAYGSGVARPEDVFYFAHRGGPNRRKGSSILRTVVNPIYAKREVYRLYPVFLATNASGIRHAQLPDEEFKNVRLRENALAVMKRMAQLPSIVTSKEWDLKIDQPGGAVGAHFKLFIDMCNESIRTGLLGDSAFSSQTGTQGARASREVSQDNVRSHFAAVGKAFAEAITEQVNRAILEKNGWSGPIPVTRPEAILSTEEARFDAFATVAELKQAGVITVDIPTAGQVQILRGLLEPVGITIEEVEEKKEEPEEEPEENPEGTEQEPKKEVEGEEEETVRARRRSGPVETSRRVRASSSSNRLRKAAEESAAKFSGVLSAGAADLGETWKRIEPEVLQQIATGLFEARPGGGWKTTDLTEARKIVVEKVRYKSSEIRKSILSSFESAYEAGVEAGKKMLPVRAFKVGTTKKGWTPGVARQILNNRVMMLLDDKYSSLASSVYYYVEQALVGQVPPSNATLAIRSILEEGEFAPGRASTILETALSTAWNAARMDAFQEFENADGTGLTDIVGYEFIAVLDDATTPGCEELNEMVFRADDPNLPSPPLHYGCRSMLVPIFGDERGSYNFLSPEDSADRVSRLQADGAIAKGFGGL